MIDANEIGRSGYQLYREVGIIPDKDKLELSFKETVEISRKLKELLKIEIDAVNTSKQSMFNCVLLSAILAYINNCDLNLFMQIDEKLVNDIEF